MESTPQKRSGQTLKSQGNHQEGSGRPVRLQVWTDSGRNHSQVRGIGLCFRGPPKGHGTWPDNNTDCSPRSLHLRKKKKKLFLIRTDSVKTS